MDKKLISLLEKVLLVANLPEGLKLEIEQTIKENSPQDFLERDLLYKVLFDMKKDFNNLKHLTRDIIDHNGSTELKENYSSKFEKKEPIIEGVIKPVAIQPLEEKSNLDLVENEKKLITEALAKHRGKRVKAARELGISERTLYRKITEWNIQ